MISQYPKTTAHLHAAPSFHSALVNRIAQAPHRHNSVALDLAVVGGAGDVYTLLGRELDSEGNIVSPLRVDWESGGVFVTPPGWWHSHHNEGDATAWVLPMQDAGLCAFNNKNFQLVH